MKRIWTKNIKIVYDNKEKCTDFDKKISSRSFFMICFDWISKRRKLTIIFWHMIHEANHEHTNHVNLKKILKKIS